MQTPSHEPGFVSILTRMSILGVPRISASEGITPWQLPKRASLVAATESNLIMPAKNNTLSSPTVVMTF